jgi:hypothetical protein
MSGQLDLLAWQRPAPPIPAIHMAGETYDPARDCLRLNALLRNVHAIMLDAGWLSLAEIQKGLLEVTGKRYGEGTIRARTADFRNHPALKDSFISESRCEKGGLWLYRLMRREHA